VLSEKCTEKEFWNSGYKKTLVLPRQRKGENQGNRPRVSLWGGSLTRKTSRRILPASRRNATHRKDPIYLYHNRKKYTTRVSKIGAGIATSSFFEYKKDPGSSPIASRKGDQGGSCYASGCSECQRIPGNPHAFSLERVRPV